MPALCRTASGYCLDDPQEAMRANPTNYGIIPEDNGQDIARILAFAAALFLIRGWCLTKMNGFPFPESRQRFRSIEHVEIVARAGGHEAQNVR
jgi:hypothetical protein